METRPVRDGGRGEKTSMARGGFQRSITRQPSSREADEDATVCLSCQDWGELGICQLYIPSPIQARRPRQSATQTASHQSPPPTFSAVTLRGTGGGIWGLFRWQFWPLWTKPRWAGFHFSCQFGHSELCCWCSTAAAKPDTDTSVKEQCWGDWSSSLKTGVSALRSLGSVFFQISVSLQSLFMRLLWAEGAIKSQLVKSPHFHHFFAEKYQMRSRRQQAL